MTDININFFKNRRLNLAKDMEDNSVLLLNSSSTILRNNDTTFPFRQDSNFYYLTGFEEPDSIMLLMSSGESILFCREKNPDLEKWDGFMFGLEGAKQEFHFDKTFDIKLADELIPTLIQGLSNLYSLIGKDTLFDNKLISWMSKANSMERHQENINLKDFSNTLGMKRLIKSNEEIELMRKSCEIASNAHINVMKNAKLGMTEFDLESMYLNEFKKGGSRFPSYNPIVAGGKNACVLHYIDNNKTINDGDMVLVDAGCEYGLYASDITRTFPINGKYSSEQREIYNIVLEAHNKACQAIKVGASCLEPQIESETVLSQGLKDIGLLHGSLDEILEKKLFREFYYHKIGHWLGLDVHDDCPYSINGEDIKFQENMVMTIEPGIYINDSADVDERWKGIGIRLENDILATKLGYENLTQTVPSEPDAIEALMKS
ncbi:aminopeptidase P N-terminal domain-containing protein [SAR86 cluster bacterium]|nr:aminopeptidase P N-terminal domain-containing protein [SAR86 cluster bacterium]